MSTVLKKGWVLRTSFKFKNDPRQFTLRIGLVLYQSDNPHRSSRLKYTKKTWFSDFFSLQTSLEFFEGWVESLNPPYSQGNISRKHSAPKIRFENGCAIRNSGDSECESLKMTHYVMTCDVIGHDVMVEPVIPNVRPGAVLYDGEVSWFMLY